MGRRGGVRKEGWGEEEEGLGKRDGEKRRGGERGMGRRGGVGKEE